MLTRAELRKYIYCEPWSFGLGCDGPCSVRMDGGHPDAKVWIGESGLARWYPILDDVVMCGELPLVLMRISMQWQLVVGRLLGLELSLTTKVNIPFQS